MTKPVYPSASHCLTSYNNAFQPFGTERDIVDMRKHRHTQEDTKAQTQTQTQTQTQWHSDTDTQTELTHH